MDLVSIIIPAYNVDDYLKDCVNSILHQTYTEYEIVVVDDGSTDTTYQVCEELALENPKVKTTILGESIRKEIQKLKSIIKKTMG